MIKIQVIILFFIWLLASPSVSICQSGYDKRIDIPHSLSFDFDDIILNGYNLVIRGDSHVDSIQKFGLLISEFDTNGILKWHKTIYPDTTNSHFSTNPPCRFIKSKSNNFVLPTYYFNSGNLGLIITDTIGTKLYEREYINSERTIFPFKIVELNSEFYIFGRVQRTNFMIDDFILKLDSVGNQKWIKYYGDVGSHEYLGGVVHNEDTRSFSISSMKYSDNYFNEPFGQGWIKPWIYTIDTSGNITNQWIGEKNDSRTLGGGQLYRLDNGDWITLSREFRFVDFDGFSFIASSPTIARLDSNFQSKWKKNLTNYTGFWDDFVDLEYDTNNQEFIAVGHKVTHYSNVYQELEAWAIKFNLDGEIIWNVSDTVYSDSLNGVRHFTSGLAISSTGSIYVVGNVEHESNPLRHYGWIIKITSDGCMELICTTNSTDPPKSKISDLKIFPNPSTDYIEIIAEPDFIPSIFTILDITGQVRESFSILTEFNKFTFKLSPGVYFYIVNDEQNPIVRSGKIIVVE